MSDADTTAAPRHPLQRVLGAVDAIGVAAGWIAAACLLALTLLIAAEIATRGLSRVVPGWPATTRIAWEYSAYLMGNAFLFGAAPTLRRGGHIRVGILPQMLPPPALRALEFVATLMGLAATAFLAYAMIRFAQTAWIRGQVSISSGTALWIPKAGLAAGASLFALQMAARLVRVIAGLPPDETRDAPSAQHG